MKKLTNMIEYNTKGQLVELEENVLKTQVTKKDEIIEDTVDLNEMLKDIFAFCEANPEKNIEMKFSIKVVEE